MCYNTLVSLKPTGQVVLTPGESVTFTCNASTEDVSAVKDIYFLLNGTRLHCGDLENAIVEIFSSLKISLSLTLRILSTEFNATRIGCRAIYSSGTESSTTTLLLIQGIEFDCRADAEESWEELAIKEVSTLMCSPLTYRNVIKVSGV